jgi:hypothetical protein
MERQWHRYQFIGTQKSGQGERTSTLPISIFQFPNMSLCPIVGKGKTVKLKVSFIDSKGSGRYY